MQETEQPSPQKSKQMQSQDQQKDEENESQSSSKQSYQNSSNENIPKNSTKLYHSQRQQNNLTNNSNNLKDNQQNSSYFNSSQNFSNQGNSNNTVGLQAQNATTQLQTQGRTNNFIKNTQSSYQSNNSGSNSVQNGNNQNQSTHPQSSNQQYPHSQSQNPANNNYFNSTTNHSNGSNQHSNYSSFNNELFAGSSMNMFKTAAGNFQSNTIQNQKKGEQPRSSTRDQFNQGSSQAQNNNNNNFNGGSSTNMYNSNTNGSNNPNSSRNNYRSSFNQATSSSNNNNITNNTGNIYQNQQSNSKATTNQQNSNSSQVSNFTSSGNVAAMANMHSSKENYSHLNNNVNLEKSSPMNPSKFTNSFKANGNAHSIYNNTSQSSENNNHFNSQQSQQSPEKMSSQKTNKNQQQQNGQQTQQQGNGHHNNHNGTSNNHTNQFNINNFHGLPNETSTFVKDENLYSIKSFSEFLKEHTRIQSLGKNTQFAQTSVLELQNNSNSLLKLASIAFFVNLISELPHPESQPNSTCQASKIQLIDIFLKVYNKKLKIHVSSTHIFTSDQLIASFTKNTGLLIQLYLLHGQNTSKLIKAFLYQVQHDPLYLDSLVILIKELAAEFVEECDYDAIASILMQQIQQHQTQQQQNSLYSTCASLSQLQENKVGGLSEKEKRAKLAQKLRQPSWKEVKPEWLFLLSLSLQRPIELFNLRDNKLEQTLFKSKKMQISEVTANNKINIVTVTQAENKFPVYYLMTMKQSETELYASLKINFKKNELKLNEEVNFPYLIKQITREKEQCQQQQQPQQPQIINSPTQQMQQNNNNSANQAQLQLSPSQSKQQQPQQSTQQNLPQSNSNTNLNKEYSMGHRSSKLGLHLNQLQQQQQQPNALYSSTNANNLNSQQHHHHNSSVEDQGRKSHSIKTNHISNLNTNGSTSNLNNPSASSPRVHNFMNNLNQLNNQQAGSQAQQSAQQQQQQQQVPSSIEPKQNNPPFSKLGNKFSHYENISPKYNLNNLNFQKSTVNSRQHQQSNSLSQDEWNKNLLYAKVKDLIFTLNINSEQLNSLARFSITNNQTGIQSKENIQPKSPLKYKSVLYPLSNNCIQQNPNGAIPPNGFSNALNNIMIGQNYIQNQNQQQNSSSTTTINSLSTNTTNNISNLNNLNNTSGTTAAGTNSASVQNGNINNNITNYTSPNSAFNNYLNSNPTLFTGQTAFNINSNSKLNTNNLNPLSPSSNFNGSVNPLLLNSTNNNNNFVNSFGKNGVSGVNNTNSSNLQNFLNSNSYNAMQSAGGMGATNNIQQQNLNTLNQQNMSSSLNGNSTLTSNSALTQLVGNAPGTVSSKRYPTSQANPNLVDSQSRDIFNKLSPRRNLNTQY